MARLTDTEISAVQADRESTARRFAHAYGCTVVLKGHRTVIAGNESGTYINPTGNSGLASGGTGDVLAGLIGGLMAQGMKGLDASLAGVFLHGAAGDAAAERMTARGMIAGDVIDALPTIWQRFE